MSTTLLAALCLAACGSDKESLPPYPEDGTDEEQIRAVADYYNVAAEDLDAKTMCEQVMGAPVLGRPTACIDVIEREMQDTPDKWTEITDISNVQFDGDMAFADAQHGGKRTSLAFFKKGGRWWMQVVW